MNVIERIMAEALRSFMEAAQITWKLFLLLGTGTAALAQRIGYGLQRRSLEGEQPADRRVRRQVCPVCQAENEQGQTICFACGARL